MESLLALPTSLGAPRYGDPEASRRLVRDSLAAVRTHLGMEVGLISRFGGGRRWVEYVDSDPGFGPVEVGVAEPLEQTLCARVVDGVAPQLMPDARAEPAVADLEATHTLPVGAHLAVPLVLEDGETFGTLCCFSRQADGGLRERDLRVLRAVADGVAGHLGFLLSHERSAKRVLHLITRVLGDDGPAMALQPVVRARDREPVAFEALARFPRLAPWSPDRWFAEATALGLGADLEGAAVQAALRLLPGLPADASLAVNLSPDALCSDDRILDRLCSTSPRRLVVELTEHVRVAWSQRLHDRLETLREAGVRIAVDDAGTGCIGLEHILHLRPEVLKLDRALVRGIATHPGRQAMCEAMVGFSRRTGATLVAEGVETEADLAELERLGVELVQGYLTGRPRPAS
jgi:EAL domain-containing protein (putative c-di-GMP-specific phosphodiesterase class I)